MIAIVILAALVTAWALVASALGAITRVTPTESGGRGPWGVVEADWKRSRRLDAHELRWQTALISGREQQSRWPDTVEDIQRLERAADVPSDPEPPESFDHNWVEARLRLLEDLPAANQPPSERVNEAIDDRSE